MNINKIKKKLIEWVDVNIFGETILSNEPISNPYRNTQFKTVKPDNFKPFTEWDDNDRAIAYNEFLKIE